MARYAVRKLVHTAFVAFGVVSLVFVALRLSGDPAATMLPGEASVEELTALRQVLDADGSLWRLFHPNGFSGKYWVGSQPGQRFHDLMEGARYSLDQKKRKGLYTEATQIIHEDKPWLELFQEVIIYGVSKRMNFKPRADYRLIVSEMTLGSSR
jgi:ABC-type transport system substrate-binding protein